MCVWIYRSLEKEGRIYGYFHLDSVFSEQQNRPTRISSFTVKGNINWFGQSQWNHMGGYGHQCGRVWAEWHGRGGTGLVIYILGCHWSAQPPPPTNSHGRVEKKIGWGCWLARPPPYASSSSSSCLSAHWTCWNSMPSRLCTSRGCMSITSLHVWPESKVASSKDYISGS